MTHQARITPFLQIKGSLPQLKPCGQLRFTAKEVWPDNNGRGGAHQTLKIAAPSTDTLAVQVSNQAVLKDVDSGLKILFHSHTTQV